uniref:Uncharacterized protein n=1 Tax=Triticum urartu TaxID=4572 RepID=A0A8R7U338_TRIUA
MHASSSPSTAARIAPAAAPPGCRTGGPTPPVPSRRPGSVPSSISVCP